MLVDCVTELRISEPINERVGNYPSPSILIDDIDIMRPEPQPETINACRLDLPTRPRLLQALQKAQQAARG